jgi:competence protein ComEA
VLVLAGGWPVFLPLWGLVGLFAGKMARRSAYHRSGLRSAFFERSGKLREKNRFWKRQRGNCGALSCCGLSTVRRMVRLRHGRSGSSRCLCPSCGGAGYVALERAGGFSGEADTEAVNLAAPLADGVHFHVPRRASPARRYIDSSEEIRHRSLLFLRRGKGCASGNGRKHGQN